ncbi:MAG: hypothetical protein WD648_14030 [Planctomycetaceae bacterium]
MEKRITDFRTTWLVLGVLAGLCLSYFWPHEPALAATTDRSDKFALATSPVTGVLEGVFILDFLTGRLQGHVLSNKVGKFSHAYYRNVAADFELETRAKPVYAVVAGHTPLTSTGPGSMAQGVIYVAELTTGSVNAYGFQYNESDRPLPPQQMIPLDRFQFREALQGE